MKGNNDNLTREEIDLKIYEELKEVREKINEYQVKQLEKLNAKYEIAVDNYKRMAKSKPDHDTRWFFDFWSESPDQKFEREKALAQFEQGQALRKLIKTIEEQPEQGKRMARKELHRIKMTYDNEYRVEYRKSVSEKSKQSRIGFEKKERKAVYKRPDSKEVLGTKKTSKVKPTTPESRLRNKFKLKLQPKNSRP